MSCIANEKVMTSRSEPGDKKKIRAIEKWLNDSLCFRGAANLEQFLRSSVDSFEGHIVNDCNFSVTIEHIRFGESSVVWIIARQKDLEIRIPAKLLNAVVSGKVSIL